MMEASTSPPLSVSEIIAVCKRLAGPWRDYFTYHFYRGRWVFEAPDGVHWVSQSDIPQIAAGLGGYPEFRVAA